VQVATGPSNPFDDIRKIRASMSMPGVRMSRPSDAGRDSNFASFLSSGTATSMGKTKEEMEVERARANAARRILSDPKSRGQAPELIAELERIAGGAPKSERGGIAELGAVAGKGLAGLGYALTRPLAISASAIKEISDIPSGGASLKDFVSQATASDTYISKYIPKTGNGKLDAILGFIADVAGDPLTYVTFGASAYASRAGRMALSAKAATKEMLEKAPTLAPKIADGSIARLGEWALTDAERQVLGVQKGLSWTFGGGKIGKEGTALGKLSAKSAEKVGKPISQLRARIGDVDSLSGVQKAVAGKSVKSAGLTRYGRGADDLGVALSDTVGKLAVYSATMRGRSLGQAWLRRIASDQEKTLKDVVAYESSTGRKLIDVVEGVTAPASQQEKELASRFSAFLTKAKDESNKVSSDFGRRRGVNVYDIGHRENYVPHTLTNEAKEYVASLKNARSPWASEISEMLDVDLQDYVSGPGTLRGRKLSKDSKWLGETLQTDIGDGAATMAEINRISQSKLGFKWFEDDASTYMNSYLNSLASQVKRVGFVDRLYDYGDDVVRKLEFEIIPDKNIVKDLRSTRRLLDKAKLALGSDVRAVGKEVESIARKQRSSAQRLVASKAGDPLLSDIELVRIRDSVSEARAAYANAERAAKSKGASIEADFNTVAAPLKAKLRALEEAISNNRQDEIVAILDLEDLHVKTFPNAKRRPTTAKQLAEDIVSKTQSRTEQNIRALETRKNRLLRSVSPGGKAGRKVADAELKYNSAMAEVAEIDKEIADLRSVFEKTTTDFPDGVALVRRADIDEVTGVPKDGGVDMFQQVPAGENLDDFIVVYAPVGAMPGEPGLGAKILKPLDDADDYFEFIDAIPNGIAAVINRLGDRQTAETISEMWDDILRNGIDAMDPSFGVYEPELATILARADQMGRRNFDDIEPEDFMPMFDNDMEIIAGLLDGWLARTASEAPDFPVGAFDDGIDMLRQSLGEVGAAREGFSETIGIDLGDIPIFGERGGLVVNSEYLAQTIEALPENSAVVRMIRQSQETGEDMPDIMTAIGGASERANIAGSVVATERQAVEAALKEVAERQARATSAGRAQGGIMSAQNRLEKKVGGLVETADRASTEVASATKQLPAVERKLKKVERELDDAMRSDPVFKTRDEAYKRAENVVAQFDTAQALKGEREAWEQTYGAAYRGEVDELNKLVETRPPSGSAAEISAAWNTRSVETLRNIQSAPLSQPQKTALDRVVRQQQGLEATLGELEDKIVVNDKALELALRGDGGKIVAKTLEGWEAIESLGVQMPPEIRDMVFGRMKDLTREKGQLEFLKAYRAYNTFFKITAMLSPGFIVRNSYTAAFNNFVAGVGLQDQLAGLRFATTLHRRGLDAALNGVPKAERALYEQAYQAVTATGSGMTNDLIVQPATGGRSQKFLNSKVVKAWAKTNEAAEVSARMGLALNSVKKGLDFDDVVNQVRRYHFDYTDVSSLDEFAKNFIPFWIFASRNIPLQITNMVARPAMYRAYESAQRNFPPDENTILPQWLAERKPIGLPGGAVLDFDLPQVDMAQQISMFTDPMRLLSMTSPAFKLPIETMGGRQLYMNTPFKDNKSEVRGPLDWPAYLAGLVTGSSGTRPDGSRYTTSRLSYAVPNLMPTLAQLQRLIPELGGKEAYLDRSTSSRAGYVGIPYRKVSQNEQFNELTRREFLIKNYLSELTRRGLLTKKEN
jgi:hypothetical protein